MKVKFIFYQYSQDITIMGQDCNSILFINKGTATVTVNTVSLANNESLSLDCNVDESDNSTYTLNFGTGTKILNVIKKYNS